MMKNLKMLFLFTLICTAGLKAFDPSGDEYFQKQRSIHRLVVRLCWKLENNQLENILNYLHDTHSSEQKNIQDFNAVDQIIVCEKPRHDTDDDYMKNIFDEFRTRLQTKDPIILHWFLSSIEFYKNNSAQ